MGMVVVIALIVGIALLPLILFASIVGLAIFIWCWNRIGRYFINFGRWLGSWRNFVPLSILGTLYILLLLLLIAFILPQLKILWIILLVLHLIVTLVCLNFAMIAWTIWLCQWFWPGYRRRVWGALFFFWRQPQGVTPRRIDGSRGEPPAKPAGSRRPAKKRSALASFWALIMGKPPQAAKSAASPQPGAADVQPPRESPTKRSWFGTFWALMLGKPTKPKKQQPKPTKVQTTEQTLGPSEGAAPSARTDSGVPGAPPSPTARAEKRTPPKRSWFSAFWALMMGRPSKSAKPRPSPAEAKTSEQVTDISDTAAATAKTGATVSVGKPAITPERPKEQKPTNRGFFAGIWTSIVRGVTFVVGLVFLGVVWIVQKIREAIEWIRIRLNLD